MGRPRKTDPAVTRERVTAAAAKLFRERGFEKTTAAAVAELLGVTPGALYYHFSSKEEILFLYLETGLEEVLRRTEAAMTAGSPAERLRQLVRTYLLFDVGALEGAGLYTSGVYGYYQLVHSLGPAERRRLQKLQRSYLDLLRGTIAEGVRDGDFGPVDVDAAAFGIVGMCAHAIHWFRPSRRLSAEELADLYADYAVSIVAGRQRAPRGERIK